MKSIAGYKVHNLLAKGGMATIYLAEQESLQRQVVLKFLNPKLDESIQKRFIDEGRIIASLEHPNIITVFDVVSTERYKFLAMEYLQGGDLENRLKTKVEIYDALTIISKISDALHLIHKQGIIHGDIKPANVLFRANGCPLLTDFGISHQVEVKKEIDTDDDVYASPTYASPELIQGKPFDYRTDIYSLGIMMYEMLVGEKPYTGTTEMEIIANSILEPIPQLPESLKELQPLLVSLLAKLPEDRLSDCKLVVRFIQKYLKDHPDLKSQSSVSKLIDNDVVVEYVSKKKKAKKGEKEKKSSYSFVSLLFLTLLLVFVIWLNREPLWQQLSEFSDSSTAEIVDNKIPDKAKNIQIEAEQSLVEKIQSEKELLKQEELILRQAELLKQDDLISQQTAEITRIKQELENQKKKARQQQLNRQRTITNFLKKGNSGLKDYRLTTPLNNNALYYFQKVLEIDAANKKAKKGIEDVVYRYELLARGEVDKYNYQKAQYYISAGLNIDEDNKRLLDLKEQANVQSEPGRVLNKVKGFFKNL